VGAAVGVGATGSMSDESWQADNNQANNTKKQIDRPFSNLGDR